MVDGWIIAIIVIVVIIIIAVIVGLIVYFFVIKKNKTPLEEAEDDFEEENGGETGPLPPEEVPTPPPVVSPPEEPDIIVPPSGTCPEVNSLTLCEKVTIDGNVYTIYPFIAKDFVSRRDGKYISFINGPNGVIIVTDTSSKQWDYQNLTVFNSSVNSCLNVINVQSVLFGACGGVETQFIFDGYNFYSYSGIKNGIALQLTFDRNVGFGLIGYRLNVIGTNIQGDIGVF